MELLPLIIYLQRHVVSQSNMIGALCNFSILIGYEREHARILHIRILYRYFRHISSVILDIEGVYYKISYYSIIVNLILNHLWEARIIFIIYYIIYIIRNREYFPYQL